jgi:AraC family transcriptional regulator, ethanolamine operon transcriptional activator
MTPSSTPAQSSVTVADISDPNAAAAGLELLSQDALALTSKPLRARRVIVRLSTAAVVYHRTNLMVRSRTTAGEGLLAFAVFGPRATGTVEGLPVHPGTLVVAAPGTEIGFVCHPGWESIALLLPPGKLLAHLADRRRREEWRWPSRVSVLDSDPARVRALFKWGKRLTTLATARPSLFDTGHAVREIAQAEMLEALLAAMRSADIVTPTRTERTHQAYSRIVKAAEGHVLASAGEHVRISDLCRITRVSERTLEYAFNDVMGLSPLAFLTRLRLNRVRAGLLAAKPGSTRVSVEALKWGFWHFGEFSRAYRECFGELPSRTLRRAAIPVQPRAALRPRTHGARRSSARTTWASGSS